MFSTTVIGKASFLKLPPTSRLLYYDLGMYADDDGFVDAYKVLQMTGASEDDLQRLVLKGFLTFACVEESLMHINHWTLNNSDEEMI